MNTAVSWNKADLFIFTISWNILDILQSTELLEEDSSAWSSSADLPYIVWGHKGLQLNNKVLMTGQI